MTASYQQRAQAGARRIVVGRFEPEAVLEPDAAVASALSSGMAGGRLDAYIWSVAG
jgi:hypothetical protein